MPCYDIEQFTWDKTHGVAEASIIRGNFISRVWDDAYDVGFRVEGKTMTLLFLLSTVERDEDIVCWKFNAIALDGRKFTITIYND
jgi:hypothetical protein